SPRRLEKPIKHWSICSNPWRNEKELRRLKLHSPGCSRRSPGLFPSPAPRNCLGWTKTSQLLQSTLRRKISVTSTALPQRSPSKELATPNTSRDWLTSSERGNSAARRASEPLSSPASESILG